MEVVYRSFGSNSWNGYLMESWCEKTFDLRLEMIGELRSVPGRMGN